VGPQGPQGPAGGGGSTSFAVRSTNATGQQVSNYGVMTYSRDCDPGEVVVSGGGYLRNETEAGTNDDFTGSIFMQASYPLDGDTWRTVFTNSQNTTINFNVTYYAVCAPSPD
jgi:hypothetical protein